MANLRRLQPVAEEKQPCNNLWLTYAAISNGCRTSSHHLLKPRPRGTRLLTYAPRIASPLAAPVS